MSTLRVWRFSWTFLRILWSLVLGIIPKRGRIPELPLLTKLEKFPYVLHKWKNVSWLPQVNWTFSVALTKPRDFSNISFMVQHLCLVFFMHLAFLNSNIVLYKEVYLQSKALAFQITDSKQSFKNIFNQLKS